MGIGMKGREKCRRAIKIALRLCDLCLQHNGINVVRRNIQHALEFLQRFRKTALTNETHRMPGEERHISRIEPLGVVQISIAPIPLAPSSLKITKRLRNLAAVWEQRSGLLKIGDRGVIVLQAGVVIKSLRQYCFA